MSKEHIEVIADIEMQCFSTPWSASSIENELANSNAYFIVYEKDKQIIGYAGMYGVCSEGYITNIAVLKKFRRQGVARCLLDELLKYSQNNSLEFLSLEVRVSNSRAINLYKSYGFELLGTRRDFYRDPKEDALIMTKFLSVKN